MTGYSRNYDIDPYEIYHGAPDNFLPVGPVRLELGSKDLVLGIEINGAAKAYPLALLQERTEPLTDRIGDHSIRIDIVPGEHIVSVKDNAGRPLPHVTLYWFAWQAFHPRTQVYAE